MSNSLTDGRSRLEADGSPLPQMSLVEHLRELRRRLVYCAGAIVIGTCIAYAYSEQIFHLLTSIFYRNFEGGALIGTGPAEAFMLKLKVAIFAGIVLMSPFILLQVWLFIAPGLYAREKRLAIPFVLCGTALFGLGVWFCYQIVLPLSLAFFAAEYQSIEVTPQVRISEHLSILMKALIGFGVAFELPVIAFFLGCLGVVTSQQMIAFSRYAIVAIFVVAGVLTPPDAITQLLMAGPLLILYGLSIVVVKITETRRMRRPISENLAEAPIKS